MQLKELRGKDSRELRLDKQAMRKELFEMRFRPSEEIAQPHRFKEIRRTVARINTVLRERELVEAQPSSSEG